MHLAWFMVSKLVAHALSYDARLVPSTASSDVAEPVGRRVEDLAHFLVHGGVLSKAATQQLRLPGAFGGMGLRAEAEGLMADASFWAAWVSMKRRVPQLALLIGLPVTACAGEADASAAKVRLEGAGVVVDEPGGVKFTWTARDVNGAGPWHADISSDELGALRLQVEQTSLAVSQGALPAQLPRRCASRIYRHLEALDATRVWQSGGRDQQESLLSAGGPGAGAVWLQMPARSADFFPNGCFRATSLRRLGSLSAPRGATCHIPVAGTSSTSQPEVCGHQLDAKLMHPQLCKRGPARMRPHRALAPALAKELRKCGTEIDKERAVAELAVIDEQGNIKEAIVDSVVTFPGSAQPLYVDVTIRCPHALRYGHAFDCPGGATSAAAKEKRERYGEDVLPIALETYGRMSEEGRRALECLATHAGTSMGDAWLAPLLLLTWRAALERIVQFAVAGIDLLALHSNFV